MLTLAKAGLAIVAGGVLLGSLLGRAADPQMKPPPAPAWRAADSAYAPAVAALVPAEEVLIPFGGFAPEPDAVIAADWPELDYSDRSPMDLVAHPGSGADLANAEQAAAAAERAALDAERAATQPPAPPQLSAGSLPSIRQQAIPGNP
jgi:hypothetical protein